MHWEMLSKQEQEALHAEQIELELRSLDVGIARFREELASRELSEHSPVRQLIAEGVHKVSEAIRSRVDDWLNKGRAMKGADYWGIPFASVEPEKLAVIGMSVMFDLADKERSLAAITVAIGDKVETEYHFMMLRQEAPRLKKMLERRFKNWTPAKIRFALRKADGLYQYWPAKRRRWVGIALLEIILEHTNWFDVVKRNIGGRNLTQILVMKKEVREAVMKQTEALEILHPFYYPMVVPPNDWGPGVQGGYRYHKLPFVKRQNNWDRPFSEDPEHGHSSVVYNAVNAIQQTPWRINRKVLQVMEQCWLSNNGRWPDVPLQNEIPHYREVSAYPENGTEDEKREWRRQASLIYDENIKLTNRRQSFLSHIMVAKKMLDYPAIYFPHHVDFRGRIYPIPQPLQPQGSDLSRGLLEFATGKPLGEEGMKWLMIHLANCFGIDKVPMQQRIDWVWDRLDLVTATAADPFSHPWWTEADDRKKWQALATIFELAEAIKNPNHISHLPVSVDGSNSGLQHFSAMLRDEEGALLTNLKPSPMPQDIYAVLAEWVNRKVEADCASIDYPLTTADTPPCLWWKGKITRKTLKRATMTYVYGVTQQGVENYLIGDGFTDGMENEYAAAKYLRKIIWPGLQENIRAATEAMKWLRQVASIANKEGKALRWTTPAGFVVVQEYIESPEVVIRTVDRSIRYRIPSEDARIQEYRQRNAIAPNFVHSMDASHLMLTVNSGSALGITHWSMIHDSFGTHASDMDLLNWVLRREFVSMYSMDVLEKFKKQIEELIGITVPEPPTRGTFNIDEVMNSEFIFA